MDGWRAGAGSDRGRRLYDRWASWDPLYRLVDAFSRPLRRRAVEALALRSGATALDVGCGPGRSLPLLSAAVGPSGRVVGVDYSAGMTRRAAPRGRAAGATVCTADARALPVADGSVDGALASLCLSAVPDPRAAAAAVRDALGPGGRLAVVDGRTPGGPVGRALDALYGRLVNWQGVDVLDALRETFPTVEVVETVDAGYGFVAVARARPAEE